MTEIIPSSEFPKTKSDFQPDCFLCGHRGNLKPIHRWKTGSRKVSLVMDFICERCEEKIEREKKFKFKSAV